MARVEKITKEQHYRYALDVIQAIAVDYDGYRTAKGLRGLVDDLAKVAGNAVDLKPVYMRGDGKPAYRIIE